MEKTSTPKPKPAPRARRVAPKATLIQATGVRYKGKTERIALRLANDSGVSFPPSLVPELANVSKKALEKLELSEDGQSLRLPDLGFETTIADLCADLFGTRAAMARKAGQATSPAKAAAARMNGAKGGRPRKTPTA